MVVLKTNAERFLIGEGSLNKIQGKWKEAVDEIVKSYPRHLGNKVISIYIGGSVGSGTQVENSSDIDAYAIVDMPDDEIKKGQEGWVEKEKKRIDKQFPFQRGIDMALTSINNISEMRRFQFKLLAALVYGKDLSTDVSDFKLDKDTIKKIRISAEKDIKTAKWELNHTEDLEEIIRFSKWVAKRLIRTTGMLVLWKKDFYTMEIDRLFPLIITEYPDQRKNLTLLLKTAQNGIDKKEEIFRLLENYGDWLISEDKRVFG
jgi:uncharacterized protein